MVIQSHSPISESAAETASPAPSLHLVRSRAVLATVNAALAVTGDGDDRVRWAEALHLLRPTVGWRRVVVVSDRCWELSLDGSRLCPAVPQDVAQQIAARFVADGPFLVEHDPEGSLPANVRAALLVRQGPLAVYFEFGARDHLPDAVIQEVAVGTLRFLVGLGYGAVRLAAPPMAGMVGESPAMRAVFDLLARHADSRAPVHIYGETGTGKEKVAQAVHAGSPYRTGPFVAVNAAALSDELFESDMFGHVRGAFTGAVAERQGYVALAQGGTLFLDEVADLTSRGQAKLLRFLQEGEYRRVGDGRSWRSNARIVTASNVPVDERVRAGTFRMDLFFRINTLTLRLPPLRERGDDVTRLGRHLLRELAATEGKPTPHLNDAAWRALERYAWPANIRELRGEMYRLVVEHPGRIVHPENLSAHITAEARGVSRLKDATARFERDYVHRALTECAGNQALTALRLGITRQGLTKKIRRLGLFDSCGALRK